MNFGALRHTKMSLLCVMVTAIVAGCAVGPDYQRPMLDLPPSATAKAPALAAPWWQAYNDAALNTLMDEALKNNRDLTIAAARVIESQALLGLATSDQLPSAYVTATRNRNRSSSNSDRSGPGQPLETSSNRTALNISYDVDFWGQYRRANEAARAELLQVESNRTALKLSLSAQVAQAYFALQALDAQLAVTARAIRRGEEGLSMQKVRFEAGVISAFEYQQREAELDAAKVQVPNLTANRDRQQRALGMLLGRSAKDLLHATVAREPMKPLNAATDRLATFAAIAADIPSEVLLRRPDLIEAEQKLIATNARIGVARAAYFPSISLTGYLGRESVRLSDLFKGPSRIWDFAANLTQPLWGAGRVTKQVEAAEARNAQALAQYQSAVVNAFRETQDALQAQTAAREVFELETKRVAALTKTWELAKLRYAQGLASQLDVLDVERSLTGAELNRIDSARAFRSAVADVYRALGAPVQE
jgi:multidrug efflux system outer membrane protein